MGEAVKVYNKGSRPIVWKRDRNGTEAIHPNKFDVFSDKKAKEIIEKFDDACSESEYKKVVETRKADAKKASKESEKEAKAEIKGSLNK